MENRQFCSWWSGVRVQDSEQKAIAAAAQYSAPFWSKISFGIYCAVAIAALCCFYTPRLYKNKKKVQQNQPGASMMEQLVPEITTHVLSYLDYKSVCSLSMTNSSMRRAANDDNAWRTLYHKDFTTEQDDVSPPNGWKSYYAATKAVKDVNTDYYKILREKNRVRMRHLWRIADYVKCVHPGGPILTGYEAVMESWEQVLNSDRQYDFRECDVRMRVDRGMAWVTLKEYVNGVVEPFLVTNIYEFHNENWFMVHHHSSLLTIAGAVDPGIYGG